MFVFRNTGICKYKNIILEASFLAVLKPTFGNEHWVCNIFRDLQYSSTFALLQVQKLECSIFRSSPTFWTKFARSCQSWSYLPDARQSQLNLPIFDKPRKSLSKFVWFSSFWIQFSPTPPKKAKGSRLPKLLSSWANGLKREKERSREIFRLHNSVPTCA